MSTSTTALRAAHEAATAAYEAAAEAGRRVPPASHETRSYWARARKRIMKGNSADELRRREDPRNRPTVNPGVFVV
jgi:hypothetical protein